jgi:hypothetical protein
MFNRELVKYNDKLYYVYRKIKSEQIKTGKVNDVKSFWGCDLILKSKNTEDELIFLREIPDAQLLN